MPVFVSLGAVAEDVVGFLLFLVDVVLELAGHWSDYTGAVVGDLP